MTRTFPFGSRLQFPLRKGFRTVLLRIATAATLATVAMASLASPAPTPEPAQDPMVAAPGTSSPFAKAKNKRKPAHASAEEEAVQPSIVIPVAPLGFAAPAPFYLGDRFAEASLNFLDEDSLLFTFRVPGLIAREPAPPGQPSRDERHVRVLTLSLPSGKVISEGLWVLHDYSRYLWMLKDRRFLLRDRNSLQIGDASLHLEPFLRFPGPVSYIEFDPGQHWLVADTTEPPAAESKTGSSGGNKANPFSQPSTAAASMAMTGHLDLDLPTSQSASQDLVRILNLDTRKVMLFSRVSAAIHLPIDGEGYYEALRGDGAKWLISYEYFQGASVPLGWVESTCNPVLDALYPGIVLVSACTATGARHLTVLSRDRDKDHCRLWEAALPPTKIWPLLASSGDGLRLARATLEVSHPIGPYSPLDNDDIRGQSVQVYDLATGKLELTVPASPVLDAGGNFALSPSGQRFAVLNAGAIQVFDLPPAPPIPTSASPLMPPAAAKP